MRKVVQTVTVIFKEKEKKKIILVKLINVTLPVIQSAQSVWAELLHHGERRACVLYFVWAYRIKRN